MCEAHYRNIWSHVMFFSFLQSQPLLPRVAMATPGRKETSLTAAILQGNTSRQCAEMWNCITFWCVLKSCSVQSNVSVRSSCVSPCVCLHVFVQNRYCVQYQLTSLAKGCQQSEGPHTLWMQYLREGHHVCVECQPPALAAGQTHCAGDGEENNTDRYSRNEHGDKLFRAHHNK